jgi:hypothetical protein
VQKEEAITSGAQQSRGSNQENSNPTFRNQDHNLEASLVTRYGQTLTKLTDSYMQYAKKQWI